MKKIKIHLADFGMEFLDFIGFIVPLILLLFLFFKQRRDRKKESKENVEDEEQEALRELLESLNITLEEKVELPKEKKVMPSKKKKEVTPSFITKSSFERSWTEDTAYKIEEYEYEKQSIPTTFSSLQNLKKLPVKKQLIVFSELYRKPESLNNEDRNEY